MRKTVLALLMVALCGNGLCQQTTKKVLFIGNSYTEVNNLPQMTADVARSAGDRLDQTSNTPGGCTFAGHCQNRSMQLIREGGWDVVVLQGQSQEPSFPPEQVAAETFPFAQQLVEAVYRYNDSLVEPMFYMTWGRKNGDAYNAQFYAPLATYEGMDSLLYERYMYMGQAFNASVCPVGRVWHYLRDNHPEIELYQRDESHPSIAGSYVAACAFYTMIFEKDPLRITYRPELDTATAVLIRRAVRSIVYDNLATWKREGWRDPVGIDAVERTTDRPRGAYQLYDIMGRPIERGEEAADFDIQRRELPKGLYILRGMKGNWSLKVVKIR